MNNVVYLIYNFNLQNKAYLERKAFISKSVQL